MNSILAERYTKGRVINSRYEILRFVGEGGQKRVYEAKDLNLEIGDRIVLKEMKRSACQDMDVAAMQLFEQECIILMRLSHPVLPKIYDFFIAEGTFFLIQEYIDGQELDAFMLNGPLTEERALEISLQIADFLDFLHRRRQPIIFRDLKPANIMIDGNSRLFAVDMSGALLPGIGKMAEKVKVKTAGYYPPDAPDDSPTPDKDVYALGVVLYELLTRYNVSRSEGSLPPVDEFREIVSPEVDMLVNRALLYSRRFRVHTAWEIKMEIEETLSSLCKYKKTTASRQVFFTAFYSFSHVVYMRYIKATTPLFLLLLMAGIPAIPYLTAIFCEGRGAVSQLPAHISFYLCIFSIVIYLLWVRTFSSIDGLGRLYRSLHRRSSRYFQGLSLITLFITLNFTIVIMIYSLMAVEVVSQFL